jgi:hypothetical protein
MTHAQFNRLVNKLRKNEVTDEEAAHCARIIDYFVEMCDDLQNSEDGDGNSYGDIFGTEGWQHHIGIDD